MRYFKPMEAVGFVFVNKEMVLFSIFRVIYYNSKYECYQDNACYSQGKRNLKCHTGRNDWRLLSQTETMYSSETKISVSLLELNVIKITTMAT